MTSDCESHFRAADRLAGRENIQLNHSIKECNNNPTKFSSHLSKPLLEEKNFQFDASGTVAVFKMGLSKLPRLKVAGRAVGNSSFDRNSSKFYFKIFAIAPQWGAADVEIKISSDESTELKGPPFKDRSRSVYCHACYAY